MKIKNNLANIVTSSRFVFSICLIFILPYSYIFYAIYCVSGFTDMIDGTIARRTNSVSELGSKLDIIADFLFVVVCSVKLLPLMNIPIWVWIWTIIIGIIKIINVSLGCFRKKKCTFEHTILNKITGLLLFILPLIINIVDLKYYAIATCLVATIAAIQEGYYMKSK